MKIERVNGDIFRLDGVPFNTGTLVPKYAGIKKDGSGVVTEAKIGFAYKSGEEIQKNFTPWQSFTDSAGASFATFALCSQYLLTALAVGDGISSILSDKGAVTQGGSTTTAVTLDKLNGVITTFTETLAADAELTFTVNNNKVTTSSTVIIGAPAYTAASTGVPVITMGTQANGSFTIVITNPGVALLNATIKIPFLVL